MQSSAYLNSSLLPCDGELEHSREMKREMKRERER